MPRLVYERIYWEDAPSTNTPLSAENLNNMDNGLAALYADVGDLEGNLDTLITSDLVPTEEYDETEQAYIATRNYAIDDLVILDKKNFRITSPVAIGESILPNADEITLGNAVVRSVSRGVEIDQNVVRKNDIVNNLLSDTAGAPLDALQANKIASGIGYVEETSIASKNYEIGELFWLDSTLCRTIASITAGDTLVQGTNYEETAIPAIPPTTTLFSNRPNGTSPGENVSITFASDPKQFSLFTFKLHGAEINGYASWVSETEIRGFRLWVTGTPNVFSSIVIIDQISGLTGRLRYIYTYNMNDKGLNAASLIELVGIGAVSGA